MCVVKIGIFQASQYEILYVLPSLGSIMVVVVQIAERTPRSVEAPRYRLSSRPSPALLASVTAAL